MCLLPLFCTARFKACAMPAEIKCKDKKVKKKHGKDKDKASFKHSSGKVGLKAASSSSEKKPMTYGIYKIDMLPYEARPDSDRQNLGKHSYTLAFGGTVEVLLQKQSYFVKKVGPKGTGPLGQVNWAKNDGPVDAFEIAKRRAGFERPSA